MNSRIPLIVAVLLAMFALGFAGSRLVSSVPHPPPPAHASLPPALASYLGTFEPGAPPDYGVVASFARTANQAAEPRRLLQRLDPALRHGVRKNASGAWRRPVRPDRSDRYLDQRDRERHLR